MQRYFLATLLACILSSASYGQNVSDDTFAMLAGTTITNTGTSVITGDVGIFPGKTITGFPPGNVIAGEVHAGDPDAAVAQADNQADHKAIVNHVKKNSAIDLSGQDLGGKTLTPGAYKFDSVARLTGILTLDGQNDQRNIFVFDIGSNFTTASASEIKMVNGADGSQVFFRVESATLGIGTKFSGRIHAVNSITLSHGASIECGAAFAQGAITLDNNIITVCK